MDRNSRCYAHSERYSEKYLSEVKILWVDVVKANETRYLLIFLQTLTIPWINIWKYHLSPSIRRVAGRIAGDALKQGWRNCGTQKVSLAHGIHCCHRFLISFARPASLYFEEYVYTHIADSLEIAFGLPVIQK